MSVEMSQERVAQVEMLIRFFNMQTGRSYKVSNEKSRSIVNDCIDRNKGDIVAIKNYVRTYCNDNKDATIEKCFDLCNLFVEEKKEKTVIQPKQEVTPEKTEFAMAILEKVIMQTIAQTQIQDYHNGTKSYMLKIKVKDAMQPIDLKRVSFPLTHTGFFRVIGFDWYSKCPEAKYMWGYGHNIESDFSNNKIQKMAKELFGDNAVWFSCSEIVKKNEEYIKEVLINAGNKKSVN